MKILVIWNSNILYFIFYKKKKRGKFSINYAKKKKKFTCELVINTSEKEKEKWEIVNLPYIKLLSTYIESRKSPQSSFKFKSKTMQKDLLIFNPRTSNIKLPSIINEITPINVKQEGSKKFILSSFHNYPLPTIIDKISLTKISLRPILPSIPLIKLFY